MNISSDLNITKQSARFDSKQLLKYIEEQLEYNS